MDILAFNIFAGWFIASNKGGYIVKRLLEESLVYWKNREEPHKYFWANHLFISLYKTDPIFRSLWDARQPILPMETFDLVHIMQRIMLRQRKTLSIEMQHFVDHPGDYIPMSKLTYKYGFTGRWFPSTLSLRHPSFSATSFLNFHLLIHLLIPSFLFYFFCQKNMSTITAVVDHLLLGDEFGSYCN